MKKSSLIDFGLDMCNTYLNHALDNSSSPTIKELDTALEKFFIDNNNFLSVKNEIKQIITERTDVIPGGKADTLSDGKQDEWYSKEKANFSFTRSNAFLSYITSSNIIPPSVVPSLSSDTEDIVKFLANPKAEKSDVRGLVYGNVQMGKTTNYSMLINKAYDIGYKLVIVLTGTTNSLRQQTQVELEKNIIGRSTEEGPNENSVIGIRKRFEQEYDKNKNKLENIGPLTKRNRDFNSQQASTVTPLIPQYDKLILVMKKNVSPLMELNKFLDNTSSGQRLKKFPVLLIDDEADLASVDTREISNPEEHEAAPIGAQIRALLDKFYVSSYVAYTATPFANTFIDPETNKFIYQEYYYEQKDGKSKKVKIKSLSDNHSRSLFPENFIIRINTPNNYWGAQEIFRLGENDLDGAIPQVQTIENIETRLGFTGQRVAWCPLKHKNPHHPLIMEESVIPESLKYAIKNFVISRIIKDERLKRKSFHTMLINVSIFVATHVHIVRQVNNYVAELVNAVRFGDTLLYDDFRKIFNEFKKTQKEFKHMLINSEKMSKEKSDKSYPEICTWEHIEKELRSEIENLEVKQISGAYNEELKNENFKGKSLIIVGSSKLSRGLVIPELAVSYFLRNSPQYDTLFQMGRWFGYRDGYMDLTRLYISDDLMSNFSRIAGAVSRLEDEFDEMIRLGKTPRDFGIKIQLIPGLQITARNKMRSAEIRDFTFDNEFSQSTILRDNNDLYDHESEKLLKTFIENISIYSNYKNIRPGRYLWRNINYKEVLSYVRDFYNINKFRSRNFNTEVFNFIETQAIVSQNLTDWSVAIIGRSDNQDDELILSDDIAISRAQRDGGWISRLNILTQTNSNIKFASDDESIDFSKDELERAIRDSNSRPKKVKNPPSGISSRIVRAETSGLLLIYPLSIKIKDTHMEEKIYKRVGIALSIPSINGVTPIQCAVNKIFSDQENEDNELWN